jgi:hypothetical protein
LLSAIAGFIKAVKRISASTRRKGAGIYFGIRFSGLNVIRGAGQIRMPAISINNARAKDAAGHALRFDILKEFSAG